MRSCRAGATAGAAPSPPEATNGTNATLLGPAWHHGLTSRASWLRFAGARREARPGRGANVRAVSSSATAGANPSRVPSRLNIALCAGSSLVLLGLVLVPALLRAEHWAADRRTAFPSDRLPSSHARGAIIPVTEDSLARLGRPSVRLHRAAATTYGGDGRAAFADCRTGPARLRSNATLRSCHDR
jgi:hypothetical protein